MSSDEFHKVAIISDLHGQFLDKRAFELFLKIYEDNDYDQLIINGDLCDFPTISRFASKIETYSPEIWRQWSLDEELDYVELHILSNLHHLKPDVPIMYRLGNHETRFMRPTKTNTTAIAEILETSRRLGKTRLEDMLHLRKYNAVLSYNSVDVLKNKFAIIHGTWLGKNRCEKLLAEYGMSGTSGHTHKMQCYSRPVYSKADITWVESGCLRTITDIEYREPGSIPAWEQGFVDVWFSKKGMHIRQHKFRKDYKYIYQGKLYEG